MAGHMAAEYEKWEAIRKSGNLGVLGNAAMLTVRSPLSSFYSFYMIRKPRLGRLHHASYGPFMVHPTLGRHVYGYVWISIPGIYIAYYSGATYLFQYTIYLRISRQNNLHDGLGSLLAKHPRLPSQVNQRLFLCHLLNPNLAFSHSLPMHSSPVDGW